MQTKQDNKQKATPEQKIKQSLKAQLASIKYRVKINIEEDSIGYRRCMDMIEAFGKKIHSIAVAQEYQGEDAMFVYGAFARMMNGLIALESNENEYCVHFKSFLGTMFIMHLWSTSKFGAKVKFNKIKTDCEVIHVDKA